MREDQTGID